MDDHSFYLLVSHLHKGCDDLVSHVDVDKDASKEGEGSAGLGDDEEVDDGVEDPGANEDPEHKVLIMVVCSD